MSDIKSEKLKSKSEVRSNNLKFDSLRLKNRSSDPVFLQARARFPVPTWLSWLQYELPAAALFWRSQHYFQISAVPGIWR